MELPTSEELAAEAEQYFRETGLKPKTAIMTSGGHLQSPTPPFTELTLSDGSTILVDKNGNIVDID